MSPALLTLEALVLVVALAAGAAWLLRDWRRNVPSSGRQEPTVRLSRRVPRVLTLPIFVVIVLLGLGSAAYTLPYVVHGPGRPWAVAGVVVLLGCGAAGAAAVYLWVAWGARFTRPAEGMATISVGLWLAGLLLLAMTAEDGSVLAPLAGVLLGGLLLWNGQRIWRR